MTSVTANLYLSKMIRAGFEKEDVDMFTALCQQCKTDIGKSREYMFLLLDMARHNKCDVMEIVKTGRVCSGQKAVNQAFVDAVLSCMASDDECDEAAEILDLTGEEESGSYEETSEHNDKPTSAEAYDIDDDIVDKPGEVPRAIKGGPTFQVGVNYPKSLARSKRLRVIDDEADEE